MESSTRTSRSIDHGDPHMANPTLILPAADNVNRKSITASSNKISNFEPAGPKTSSDREKVIKGDGKKGFQKNLKIKGVSVYAAKLKSS